MTYNIRNTAGNISFTIAPNTVDGYSGAVQHTDLHLFGKGKTVWGEKENENIYKLLENFACPEKPNHPNIPMDSSDLGLGNGINVPIPGQLWFNTTTNDLLIYDGNSWNMAGTVFSGPTPPANPKLGDLWYNVNGSPPSINYCSNLTPIEWTPIVQGDFLPRDGSLPMLGNLNVNFNRVVNVNDPINLTDGTNKQYTDAAIQAAVDSIDFSFLDNYVKKTGDTMTGGLTITSQTDQGYLQLKADTPGNPDVLFYHNSNLISSISAGSDPSNYLKFETFNYNNPSVSGKIELFDSEIKINVPIYDSGFVAPSGQQLVTKEYVDDVIAIECANSGGSGCPDLNGITDVTINSPTNNQVLMYNGSIWTNKSLQLGDLEQVNVGSPQNNQILAYNGSYWVPTDPPTNTGGTVNSIDDIGDVHVSTATTDQLLQYQSSGTNGPGWYNATLPTASLVRAYNSDPVNGYIIFSNGFTLIWKRAINIAKGNFILNLPVALDKTMQVMVSLTKEYVTGLGDTDSWGGTFIDNLGNPINDGSAASKIQIFHRLEKSQNFSIMVSGHIN